MEAQDQLDLKVIIYSMILGNHCSCHKRLLFFISLFSSLRTSRISRSRWSTRAQLYSGSASAFLWWTQWRTYWRLRWGSCLRRCRRACLSSSRCFCWLWRCPLRLNSLVMDFYMSIIGLELIYSIFFIVDELMYRLQCQNKFDSFLITIFHSSFT